MTVPARMPARPLRGALFDMDGLLFDSERIGVDMITRAGREMGYDLPRSLICSTLGCTKEKSREIYRGVYPDLDHSRLYDRFVSLMIEYALKEGMPLKLGARELPAFLKERGIPCVLATSSGPRAVSAYLAPYPALHACFTAVLCGSGQYKSKPDPDIFLAAAQAIHMLPEDCAVFEDSENGIRAGRAAGCFVCMVPDLIPWKDGYERYVDRVLRSLVEAEALF